MKSTQCYLIYDHFIIKIAGGWLLIQKTTNRGLVFRGVRAYIADAKQQAEINFVDDLITRLCQLSVGLWDLETKRREALASTGDNA